MSRTLKILVGGRWQKTAAVLLVGFLVVTSAACANDYTDETMQPLAATANDIARAVMRFTKANPAKAASLDDRELVRHAAAHDPNLLAPYKDLVVRGTADGVILVCAPDGRRGLFEDAECTDKVDRMEWTDKKTPCQFTLNVKTICP